MKNTWLLTFSLFLIFSCSKETFEESPQSISSTVNLRSGNGITYQLNNIPLIENNQNVIELLKNPNDRDDEKINHYLYILSLAIRDLTFDGQFNQTIIDLARQSEAQTAKLMELRDVAPHYYDMINNNLANLSVDVDLPADLTLELIDEQLTHAPIHPHPDYPQTAELEYYTPGVFIPNLDRINDNLQVLISPNIEVNCTEDESIEDNIVIWYGDEQANFHEIILSEETSLATDNPLFLLDNSAYSLEIAQDLSFTPFYDSRFNTNSSSNNANSSSSNATTTFYSGDLSIESGIYKYEQGLGGSAEFTITAVYFRSTSSGNEVIPLKDFHPNEVHNYVVIDNISNNEMGILQGSNATFHSENIGNWANPWTPDEIPDNRNTIWWNTYERDWNKSLKGLGTVEANGETYNLTGRRRYTSEWYAWIPSTTQVHYTRHEWICDAIWHWNNSWKSQFELFRNNPC